MNCPKCNYDMFPIYDEVLYTGIDSKYCKVTNVRINSFEVVGGQDWDVECICPRCNTKFIFSDGDY